MKNLTLSAVMVISSISISSWVMAQDHSPVAGVTMPPEDHPWWEENAPPKDDPYWKTEQGTKRMAQMLSDNLGEPMHYNANGHSREVTPSQNSRCRSANDKDTKGCLRIIGVQHKTQAAIPPGWDTGETTNSKFMTWSNSGPIQGLYCTQVLEPAEPEEHTWSDNYVCTAEDLGLKWSYAGRLDGMRCTQVFESADPHTWTDNYVCLPNWVPIKLFWSSHMPIEGKACAHWNEPSDPDTWEDNYLCW